MYFFINFIHMKKNYLPLLLIFFMVSCGQTNNQTTSNQEMTESQTSTLSPQEKIDNQQMIDIVGSWEGYEYDEENNTSVTYTYSYDQGNRCRGKALCLYKEKEDGVEINVYLKVFYRGTYKIENSTIKHNIDPDDIKIDMSTNLDTLMGDYLTVAEMREINTELRKEFTPFEKELIHEILAMQFNIVQLDSQVLKINEGDNKIETLTKSNKQ